MATTETAVKERPILFSAPMIKALLDGSKTQTRRIVKPQPEQAVMSRKALEALEAVAGPHDPHGWTWKGVRILPWPSGMRLLSPYGYVGQRLWVKETHRFSSLSFIGGKHEVRVAYPADNHLSGWLTVDQKEYDAAQKSHGFKPSIFMRRKYSRILLEIVSVRVERLQDISEADAIAEGVRRTTHEENGRPLYLEYGTNPERPWWFTDPRHSYRTLWEQINGPGSWALNPFVWVVEFKAITPTTPTEGTPR